LACFVASATACIPMRPTDVGIPATAKCKPYTAATASDIVGNESFLTTGAMINAFEITCPGMADVVFLDTRDGGGNPKFPATSQSKAACIDERWQAVNPDGSTFELETPPNSWTEPVVVACAK
ncbi:hypothetical protein PENTCL1PPCAC_14618, partial [Pristionchus entomophagus]